MHSLRGVAWRGVAWRGVAWRGVAWRGVAWRCVALRGVGVALGLISRVGGGGVPAAFVAGGAFPGHLLAVLAVSGSLAY